jgi:hypothetical protein
LIEDIAHALSNQCRFGGHVKKFYSVAQHSIIVAWQCQPEDAPWGLLHDASETYLGDMVSPLKRDDNFGFSYREAEAKLLEAISKRFDLPGQIPPSVKLLDAKQTQWEFENLLMSNCPDSVHFLYSPSEAERKFLREFHRLMTK